MNLKLTTILGFLALICMSSCGSETFEERALGVWNLERDSYVCDDPSNNYSNSFDDGCATEDGEEWCITMTITATTATITEVFAGDSETREIGTVTLDDVNETITICPAANECATTEPITGDILTFSVDQFNCVETFRFKKK